MKRITKKNLLFAILISMLAILSAANAVGIMGNDATLSLDESTKSVPVGGTVDFTVTLQTSVTGSGQIAWSIASEDPITAKLGNKPLSKVGIVTVNTPPSPQEFILTVVAGNGAVIGQEYSIQLYYMGFGTDLHTANVAMARAEAGVIPTPELSPSILMAVGLIGLIGLVRMRRKD